MSFILDALKKSESDRQRHTGPALFEVKVAAPRPGLPLWAIALAVLLLVNVGVVAWLVLRKPAPAAPLAMANPQPAQTMPATAAPSVVAPVPAQPVQVAPSEPQAMESAPEQESISPEERLDPDDYEPAVNPNAGAAAGSHFNTNQGAGPLPTYAELTAVAGADLPALRLDMHVYSSNPQGRFILLNMQRLHEGGSLPDGVRVEQITQDGVILSYRSSRFMLERE